MQKVPDLIECLKAKFQDRLRNDRDLAKILYASMCNCEYVHKKTGYTFCPTWRVAGRLVAEIRDVGEKYTSFYCSGGENGVYKKPYKLIKKCGWRIRPLTLTERIDRRIERKELKKALKQNIKTETNPRRLKLAKFLLERLK